MIIYKYIIHTDINIPLHGWKPIKLLLFISFKMKNGRLRLQYLYIHNISVPTPFVATIIIILYIYTYTGLVSVCERECPRYIKRAQQCIDLLATHEAIDSFFFN